MALGNTVYLLNEIDFSHHFYRLQSVVTQNSPQIGGRCGIYAPSHAFIGKDWPVPEHENSLLTIQQYRLHRDAERMSESMLEFD
jgi:hypothetical protein